MKKVLLSICLFISIVACTQVPAVESAETEVKSDSDSVVVAVPIMEIDTIVADTAK